MAKSTNHKTQASVGDTAPQQPQPIALEPVVPQQPQSVYQQQPVYYPQPQYVPRQIVQATHPALELSLAIIAAITSVWFFGEALTGTLSALANVNYAFGSLSSIFVDGLYGFAGIMISAVVSLLAALVAFWLFGRTKTAVDSGEYKIPLQVGFGVIAIKTAVLAASTVAVGLTPLLTLQDGSDVGPVYLAQFLPLLITGTLFGLLGWYILKLIGKQQVGRVLSIILLIASSVVFIFGLVVVIVKSHSSDYTPHSSSRGSSSLDLDNSKTKSSDTSGSSKSLDACTAAYEKYRSGDITSSEYIKACS